MARILVALAVALIWTAAANAQSQATDPRVEMLLQRLSAEQSQTQRAVVNRHAKIRFRVTINGVSALAQFPAHSARCEFTFTHFTAAGVLYQESKSVRVSGPSQGQSVLCDQTVPFHWPNADNTRTVNISIVVRDSHSSDPEPLRTRLVNRSLPPIALPTEDQVVLVTDDVDW